MMLSRLLLRDYRSAVPLASRNRRVVAQTAKLWANPASSSPIRRVVSANGQETAPKLAVSAAEWRFSHVADRIGLKLAVGAVGWRFGHGRARPRADQRSWLSRDIGPRKASMARRIW